MAKSGWSAGPAKALYSAAADKSIHTANQWVSKHWILYDPDKKGFDSKKPLFRKRNGTATDDPGEAQVFPTKGDAKKVGDSSHGEWVPRRLSDFWPEKKK